MAGSIRTLAFFLPTLTLVAVAHLRKTPGPWELVGALVSTLLVLTLPFTVGDLLARRRRGDLPPAGPRREAASGAAAALFVQFVICGLWLSFPVGERDSSPLWFTLGHPLLALLAGAFGPPTGSPRFRRLDGPALSLTAGHVARVVGLFAALGLALQLVRGDRWQLTAPFTFALPPAVIAALLGGAAGLWVLARRRLAARIALASAVVIGLLAVGRDLRPGDCSRSDHDRRERLVTWNVAHRLDGAIARQLLSLAADHLVLVEADRVDLRLWTLLLSDHHSCAPAGGVVILSRDEIRRCHRYELDERSHAVLAEVEGEVVTRLIGVDVDGHPLRSRRRPIQAIADLVGDQWPAAIVAGDFNTPGRAWAFDPLRRTHRSAFAVAGRGWAGSWPAPLPLLDIDHIWLPASLPSEAVCCARFLPSAGSDHRPLVVDLAATGGGSRSASSSGCDLAAEGGVMPERR